MQLSIYCLEQALMKNKGIFISFEGPEASGKSSQILLLKNSTKKNIHLL